MEIITWLLVGGLAFSFVVIFGLLLLIGHMWREIKRTQGKMLNSFDRINLNFQNQKADITQLHKWCQTLSASIKMGNRIQ